MRLWNSCGPVELLTCGITLSTNLSKYNININSFECQLEKIHLDLNLSKKIFTCIQTRVASRDWFAFTAQDNLYDRI